MRGNGNTIEGLVKIPFGYCQCGCGSNTKPASETNHRTGSKKGYPLRFIHGHNRANYKNGRTNHIAGYVCILNKPPP